MKLQSILVHSTLFISAGIGLASSLTWDTVTDGATITSGAGTWNLTATNLAWNNAGTNERWTNPLAGGPANDAFFKGITANTVVPITIGSDNLVADTITVSGPSTIQWLNNYNRISASSCAVQTTGAGKLALTSSSGLSNIAALSIANGSTLFLSGGTVTSNISIAGPGNTENIGALRAESNAVVQGTISLLADATFGTTGGTATISSVISGNHAFNQAATHSGTTRLTGDNTFTGGTTIAKGSIQIGHTNAFGTGLVRLNGGTLSSSSSSDLTLPNALILGGSATLGATSTGKLSFASAVTAESTATLTFNSPVEFTELRLGGALTKAGAGTLTLGKITVLSTDATLTGTTVATLSTGTTIDTNGFDASFAVPFSGSGPLIKSGSGTLTLSGPATTFSGPIQINGGTLKLSPTLVLPPNLKIMPTGDSITLGQNGGYRAPLFSHLSAIAPGSQYVGDSTYGSESLPTGQKNHCGHGSYSSSDINKNLDGLDTATWQQYGDESRNPHGGYWLTGIAGTRAPLYPDVVLLMVGANDIFRLTLNNQQAHESYTALLTKWTTLRPDAAIFMAKITPHGDTTKNVKVIAYNSVIETVYNEFKAAGKKVFLADMYTGYTGGWIDNLHPSAAGYTWMAGRWRDTLQASLGTGIFDLRAASSLTISAGAILVGEAKLPTSTIAGVISPGGSAVGRIEAATTSLSGSYRCDLSGTGADVLAITGDLNLSSATLTLSTLEPSTSSVHTIATYTGNLTGSFSQVTGLPEGYKLAHDPINKRLIIAKPYAIWRASQGLPDISFNSPPDADSDGVPDIMEFATGGKANDASSKGFQTTALRDLSGDEVLVLSIATRLGAQFTNVANGAMTGTLDGVTYRIEGSKDLAAWLEIVSEVPAPAGLDPAPPGYEYHSFRLPTSTSSEGRGFLRLQVIEIESGQTGAASFTHSSRIATHFRKTRPNFLSPCSRPAVIPQA